MMVDAADEVDGVDSVDVQSGDSTAFGGDAVMAGAPAAPQLTRLVDAGLELFGTTGYEATTIRELCRLAQVSTRDFYRHVHDRAQLFEAVFEREVDRVLSAVSVRLQDLPLDVGIRTRAWVEEWMGAMLADPRRYRVLYTEAIGVSAQLEHRRRALLVGSCEMGMHQLELCARARGERPPEHHYEVPAIALFGSAREMLVRYMNGTLSTTNVGRLIDQHVRLCVLVGENW